MINRVTTTLKFGDKYEALRLHVYAIAAEEGLTLSPADISVIVEIYKSGYDNTFHKRCVDAGYFKSVQTVRNCVSKLTRLGILDKLKGRGKLKIRESMIPFDSSSDFILIYNVIYDSKVSKRGVPKGITELTGERT